DDSFKRFFKCPDNICCNHAEEHEQDDPGTALFGRLEYRYFMVHCASGCTEFTEVFFGFNMYDIENVIHCNNTGKQSMLSDYGECNQVIFLNHLSDIFLVVIDFY